MLLQPGPLYRMAAWCLSSSFHLPSWPDPVWPGLGLRVQAPLEPVRVAEQVSEQTPRPDAIPAPARVHPSSAGSPALSLHRRLRLPHSVVQGTLVGA